MAKYDNIPLIKDIKLLRFELSRHLKDMQKGYKWNIGKETYDLSTNLMRNSIICLGYKNSVGSFKSRFSKGDLVESLLVDLSLMELNITTMYDLRLISTSGEVSLLEKLGKIGKQLNSWKSKLFEELTNSIIK